MTPEQLKYSILKKAFCGQLVVNVINELLPKVKKVGFDEDPFDIPDEWFWSCLGNCCDMYTGNSISESVKKAKYAGLKEGLDYIATKDVSFEHTIEYDNGVRIPPADNFRIAYSGSVLMCIEGGSAGRKIGILDRDVCFGNKLCSFNSKEILNTYIYYYLQSYEFKAFFMGNMSGIIGGVSIKKLKELPIPIPSIKEQKAIVAKIEELLPFVDRYAASWEKLKQFNAKFPEEMKKSILQYAIQGKLVEQRAEEGNAEDLYQQIQEEKQKLIKEGKIKKEKPLAEITDDEIPFDIPESWKWVKLGEVVSLLSGSDFSPDKYNENGNGMPYMTGASNIDNNKLIINRWTPTPNNISHINDLLLVCKGSGYGKTVKNDIGDVHIARQFMAFQSGLSLDYDYLNYFLQSHIGQIKQNGQGVIPGIDREFVLNMIFPLPPFEEQKRIKTKIEKILPYCNQLIK